ncbi:MAG: tetratricopeptide repeat protein [Holophagales bacterium]|nr:tetratricopeptide repeat protein [Holophagales bacterium]MYF97500.1 tetratricopeptide repeat protein [Holophagales bacterium]
MSSPRRRDVRAWLLPCLLAGPLAAQSEAGSDAQLPDVECLRLMRKARIAELTSRPTEEVAWLNQAREECNEPVTPLVALLTFHQRVGLPEAEVRDVRRELVAALDDPAGATPGVLSHIARAADAEESVLRAALGLVERRLAEDDAEDRARFLRLSAVLNERLGRPEEALSLLYELRILEPGNEIVNHLLLRSLEAGGRWSEAADLLAELTASGGPYVRSRFVRALARAGRLEEAQRELELLGQEWNDEGGQARLAFSAVVLSAAWNLRDAGKIEEAESLFRRASEFAPPESWAATEADRALVNLYGTTEERAALREEARRRFEQEADGATLLNEGARLLSAGEPVKALDLFRRASEELGHLEAVWYNLGFAAYRAERWEEAAEALDRAAQLNPERVENAFFSGLALVELERWEEAIPRLLRTLELDPARRLAHYNLWVCYKSLGREAEAAAHRAAYDASR